MPTDCHHLENMHIVFIMYTHNHQRAITIEVKGSRTDPDGRLAQLRWRRGACGGRHDLYFDGSLRGFRTGCSKQVLLSCELISFSSCMVYII